MRTLHCSRLHVHLCPFKHAKARTATSPRLTTAGKRAAPPPPPPPGGKRPAPKAPPAPGAQSRPEVPKEAESLPEAPQDHKSPQVRSKLAGWQCRSPACLRCAFSSLPNVLQQNKSPCLSACHRRWCHDMPDSAASGQPFACVTGTPNTHAKRAVSHALNQCNCAADTSLRQARGKSHAHECCVLVMLPPDLSANSGAAIHSTCVCRAQARRQHPHRHQGCPRPRPGRLAHPRLPLPSQHLFRCPYHVPLLPSLSCCIRESCQAAAWGPLQS